MGMLAVIANPEDRSAAIVVALYELLGISSLNTNPNQSSSGEAEGALQFHRKRETGLKFDRKKNKKVQEKKKLVAKRRKTHAAGTLNTVLVVTG